MADNRIIPINPGTDLNTIINQASQNLQTQGFNVQAQMFNQNAASMTVSKDNDGFKNFIGLGIECRVNIALVNPGQISVSIDSEWTNKIIALVVGWFLCMVPFITGIIGCINQSGLPEKIFNALTAASTGYGQPPVNNYQPPVNNYQHPVNTYQPPVNNYQPPVNQQPTDNNFSNQ